MTAEGWLFMVGLRVFDVGLLIVWLVWFFRLREDDDSSEDEGGGGGGPRPPSGGGPKGGGGLSIPLGRAAQGKARLRDSRAGARSPRRRGAEPRPHRVPVRVRRPRTPSPGRRVV